MIQYNKSIMKFFKDQGFALATLADVELGVTYYSNSFSVGKDGFQITKLLTDKEHWDVWANHINISNDPISKKTDEIAWFQIDGANGPAWHSLADCNVGASYNPWISLRFLSHLILAARDPTSDFS